LNLIFRPIAQGEFEDAFDWYASRSPKAAIEFTEEVAKATNRIMQNPLMYASVGRRYRAVLVHRYPYRIIYRIVNDTIFVVAVAHTKLRPTYWRGRQ
jgi:toxin ParE1/3/4